MGGGLMQLVAYGAQDIYLTGNPQITFFKVVYRRHTNFARELVQQTLNGSVTASSSVTATISRNGDLVYRMYARWNPSASKAGGASGTYPSHCLLKEVEVEIGGQRIDKHYGHWLTAWHELTSPNPSQVYPVITGTKLATSIPVGVGDGAEIEFRGTKEQQMAFHVKVNSSSTLEECNAWVPLQFWFCRNPGLALPLIALQYHEVKVKITLPPDGDLWNATGTVANSDLQLWADYIYLDTDERRRFAQVSHEYLIEQVQFQEFSADTATCKLNFNHPVKELVFGTGRSATTAGPNGSGASFTRIEVVSGTDARTVASSNAAGCTVQLKLNGHDRFAAQPLDYFTRTQVWEHHTGNGGVQSTDSIGVYSFALKPEEHQPSGTCNFSRIDNAQLVFSKAFTGAPLRVYAVNYNVLRIMSGMGGLAYSN